MTTAVAAELECECNIRWSVSWEIPKILDLPAQGKLCFRGTFQPVNEKKHREKTGFSVIHE